MKKSRYKTIVLITLSTAVAFYSCRTTCKTTSDNFKAIKHQESLERGKNLTYNICGGCHYNKETGTFIGMQMHDLPKFMGKVFSANLTASQAYGVPPHYTDAELVYLVKTGIKNNGRFIPYMVRPNIADKDMNDIIIYLRSGDAPVAPADTTVGKTHLNFLGKLSVRIVDKPLPYKKDTPGPSETDRIEYGRYLVDNLGCYHCHSKGVISLNYMKPEKSKGFMAGGMKFKDLQGKKVHASNLTSDVETGIGKYTRNDFETAMKEGITPSGRHLRFPMPKFRDLNDKQMSAIYAYLQSLPAKHHKVKHK